MRCWGVNANKQFHRAITGLRFSMGRGGLGRSIRLSIQNASTGPSSFPSRRDRAKEKDENILPTMVRETKLQSCKEHTAIGIESRATAKEVPRRAYCPLYRHYVSPIAVFVSAVTQLLQLSFVFRSSLYSSFVTRLYSTSNLSSSGTEANYPREYLIALLSLSLPPPLPLSLSLSNPINFERARKESKERESINVQLGQSCGDHPSSFLRRNVFTIKC